MADSRAVLGLPAILILMLDVQSSVFVFSSRSPKLLLGVERRRAIQSGARPPDWGFVLVECRGSNRGYGFAQARKPARLARGQLPAVISGMHLVPKGGCATLRCAAVVCGILCDSPRVAPAMADTVP